MRPEECNVYCTDEQVIYSTQNTFHIKTDSPIMMSGQVCGQPTKWSKVGAGLRQIDAGGNALWGLSKDNALLVVTDTLPEKNFTWTKVGSNRIFSINSHVSVSEKDKVWTIDTDKTKKGGFIGTQEDPMSKKKDPKGYYVKSDITGSSHFRVVAVGKAGVWAITQDKAVFFKRDSEQEPEKAQKEGLTKIWKRVEGAELVWIAVGSHVWGVDSENKVVFRTGVTHGQPSGVEWRKVKRAGSLTQIDTMGEDVWAVDAEGKIHRRITQSTGKKQEGPAGQGVDRPADQQLAHVTVGPGGVYGVTSVHNLVKEVNHQWVMVNSTNKWRLVDIGNQIVWGITTKFKVFQLLKDGTQEVQMDGRLKQLSVSPKGDVWGVNLEGTAVQRVEDRWEQLDCDGDVKHGHVLMVAVGQAGVWLITKDHEVFHRIGTQGDRGVPGSAWVKIEGKLKWISSNRDVWGIGMENQIMVRTGCSSSKPMGIVWRKIEGHLTQIDAFDNEVRGVEFCPKKTESKNKSKNKTVWEWNKYGAPDAKGERTFKEWKTWAQYNFWI